MKNSLNKDEAEAGENERETKMVKLNEKTQLLKHEH